MRPLFVVFALIVFFLPALPAAEHYDLLIEGAVDFELGPLLDSLQSRHQVQIGSWTYWTGRIGTKSVVVARTGQGPINAAASTAFAIDRFHPAAIVDQGTAGAHNPDFQVFDIVLGASTTDFSGYHSDHKDAGAEIDVTQWIPTPHELRIGGANKTFPTFPGDPALLASARNTPYNKGMLRVGTVGSANSFNRQIDFSRWVRKTFGTDSEDMESAYAAGVAAGMQIPFLAVRIISNSEYNHPTLERAAGTYCAQFVVDLIKKR